MSLIPRYDPSSSDAHLYELEQSKGSSTKDNVKTSKERFLAVTSTLKDLFSKDEPEDSFRLGSLFGAADEAPQLSVPSFDKPKDRDKTHKKQSKAERRKREPQRFFFSKNDPRLEEDPFFNPAMIASLKEKLNSSKTRDTIVSSLAAKKREVKKPRKFLTEKEKQEHFQPRVRAFRTEHPDASKKWKKQKQKPNPRIKKVKSK